MAPRTLVFHLILGAEATIRKSRRSSRDQGVSVDAAISGSVMMYQSM